MTGGVPPFATYVLRRRGKNNPRSDLESDCRKTQGKAVAFSPHACRSHNSARQPPKIKKRAFAAYMRRWHFRHTPILGKRPDKQKKKPLKGHNFFFLLGDRFTDYLHAVVHPCRWTFGKGGDCMR